MSKIILVGPDPAKVNQHSNPGGQLTAAIGLKKFLSIRSIDLEIIDTLQVSFPLPTLIFRLNRGLGRFKSLVSLIKTKNYQAVLLFTGAGYSFYERSLLCAVCRIYSFKSIMMIRDGHFKAMMESSYSQALFIKFFLLFPREIVVQGNSWKRLLVNHGVSEDKITVVRNWVSSDAEIADHSITISRSLEITFTFIGWVIREKGIHELVEAIKRLRRKGYLFSVNVIGDGDLKDAVTSDIESSLGKDLVNFTGWLKKDQINEYLNKTHVLVLPSYAEGFPNVLLEAMSKGIPAIATSVGAIPDTVKNNVNGILIESKSADSLEMAMESYIKNPNLIEIQSKQALLTIKREHDFDANLSNLLQLL